MKIMVYEHRSGLKVIPSKIVSDIGKSLEKYRCKIEAYSTARIKQEIKNELTKIGWSGEYRLDVNSKITISSYMDNVGMCFQTGNVGRIYADLLKLQALFTKGNIVAGIIIVPKQNTAKVLGTNMISCERLLRELPIFKQVVTVPLVIIGFDGVEG